MLEKLQCTYLLVAHGSRDPRPQIALEKLAKLLSEQLAILTNFSLASATAWPRGTVGELPMVGTGTLELAPTSLHEQICQFGERTRSRGLTNVQVLPLFLLPGVHVKEDIPAEVAIAQQRLGQTVKIELRSHLGADTIGLANWVVQQMRKTRGNNLSLGRSKWVILSHGTRREGGNWPVEEIAEKLQAVTAYWSVSPSLEERVERLVKDGYRQIGIVPYFLFSGGIIEAIAHAIQQLQQQYSSVEFSLAEPLETSGELVDLILKSIAY